MEPKVTENSQNRRELESHLIGRALRDDAFRRLLISNPRKALETEIESLQLGVALPPGLKVRVLEESPDTMYLILPPSLTGEGSRQDDFFLEAIKGLNPGATSNEPA